MPGKLKHVTDGYARSREAFFRLMTGNECWSKQCWKELCCAVMLMRHGLIKIGASQRQEYCILSFKITLKLVTNLTLIKLQTCNLQLTPVSITLPDMSTLCRWITKLVQTYPHRYESDALITAVFFPLSFFWCVLLKGKTSVSAYLFIKPLVKAVMMASGCLFSVCRRRKVFTTYFYWYTKNGKIFEHEFIGHRITFSLLSVICTSSNNLLPQFI